MHFDVFNIMRVIIISYSKKRMNVIAWKWITVYIPRVEQANRQTSTSVTMLVGERRRFSDNKTGRDVIIRRLVRQAAQLYFHLYRRQIE